MSPRQWLRLLKLFELEVSTRKLASHMGSFSATAYKAVITRRLAVLAHAPDGAALLSGEVEPDESYIGGKRKGRRGRGVGGKVTVFGILERDGQVFVSTVPNVKAETLLDLTVSRVKRGSIVYNDRFRAYDALMFCGYRHLQVDHAVRFSR